MQPIIYHKNEFPPELARTRSYISFSVGWNDGTRTFCVQEGRSSGWQHWITKSGSYDTFTQAYEAAEKKATALAAAQTSINNVCLLHQDDNRQQLIGSWGLSKSQEEELSPPPSSKQPNQNPLATFYYTFGTSESFPYKRGWVEIQAHDQKEANQIFREHFPDKTPGILNCAFVYDEVTFQQIRESMSNHPDWHICHQQIKAKDPTAKNHTTLSDQIQAAQNRSIVTPSPQSNLKEPAR